MTLEIREESVFAKPDSVLQTEVEQKTILMSTDNGKFIELNGQGSAIWGLIDGNRNAGEIHKILCARHDVAPEECEQDLYAFLSGLQEVTLIELTK
ncbi:hypothetical protein GCM10023115_24120 [Pontixanthobacter gangjinensis]|uniref:PqqD family peptide modification chaperone n=1 Tax=Pontixanthobacter gangjinensis TaxID=1028742 RepID=A0A6I4SPG1_9SPHN|nr:PqqD family protein [Pontixanthobacter gangjinensis]MXO57654.1 PqqD family peptide modification chaperone [Pontixanthobacter gangjinensis]